jgi:hypothetical protein
VTYKGIEYQIVQTANPTGWKWIVLLDVTRTRKGISHSRAHAVVEAQRAIDKATKDGKKRPKPGNTDEESLNG